MCKIFCIYLWLWESECRLRIKDSAFEGNISMEHYTSKIMIKMYKNRPKSSKIWKFQNKFVYGGYVPAPYTR